ncbi:MAG: AarF/UbiB family protein [Planctomycetota bacterium]
MKRTIPSVPQLYRNVRRWTEIVSVLSKYGLADWLSRFQIDFLTDLLRAPGDNSQSKLNQHQRIRFALSELGPTFIKFGQLLSTRPDLIGSELADELSNLQSDTPSDAFEVVKATIEEEQGLPLKDIFESFDETPIASASIGQVHGARLRVTEDDRIVGLENKKRAHQNGDPPPKSNAGKLIDVVVKIRHAGIVQMVETDLDILAGLAQLADRLEDFKNYQPSMIVREITRTMLRELEFERESRNLQQFRTLFEASEEVELPKPYPELCTNRMITMQRMFGISLRDTCRNGHRPDELVEIARSGANLYLQMIFNHGFYHADPHPGNILILDDGKIALLDFGMVGRISEQLREDIESMLVAIVNQDVAMLTALTKRVGNCPFDLDESALSNDIADFVGQYSTQVVAHFDMSGALRDFVSLVRSYEITLPSEASMLIKVLVTLEGTGRQLNPDFSLMEVMKPFQRMLILKRLSPARQLRKMRRFYLEVEQLFDSLPTKLTNILEQVQSGRFDIHLDHRRLGPTANRLVLGLMTSALFLGSALMLSYKVPPLLFPTEVILADGTKAFQPSWFLGIHDLSMLGLTGAIVSIFMGLRLIWAIRKSGNLDKTD